MRVKVERILFVLIIIATTCEIIGDLVGYKKIDAINLVIMYMAYQMEFRNK